AVAEPLRPKEIASRYAPARTRIVSPGWAAPTPAATVVNAPPAGATMSVAACARRGAPAQRRSVAARATTRDANDTVRGSGDFSTSILPAERCRRGEASRTRLAVPRDA